MHDLAQQIVSGLAQGSIFASLALALVLIYRAMGIINFAQGELAMFTTYIAWQLTQMGLPIWLAFAATVVVAFAGGVALERIVIRPVENSPILVIVIVFIALLVIFNSVAGWIFTYTIKSFPSPFPTGMPFGIRIPRLAAIRRLLRAHPRLRRSSAIQTSCGS